MEQALFGNVIDAVYNTKGRSLHSKDSKQTPKYLKAVDKHLEEHKIYQRIIKLMNSKTHNHREAEAIDGEITQATQYGGN